MWTCTQNDVSPTPTWNCECHVDKVMSRTKYPKTHGYATKKFTNSPYIRYNSGVGTEVEK